MDTNEKQKAIEYLVHDIFMTQHNRQLAIFLASYGDQVRKSAILSAQIGIPIAYPPLIFDLRKPAEDLVRNLVQFEVLHKPDDNEHFQKKT